MSKKLISPWEPFAKKQLTLERALRYLQRLLLLTRNKELLNILEKIINRQLFFNLNPYKIRK